jgi:hypothetical protein
MRVIAIDWSGSQQGQREHIWNATVEDGQLASLANGLTRQEVIDDRAGTWYRPGSSREM